MKKDITFIEDELIELLRSARRVYPNEDYNELLYAAQQIFDYLATPHGFE